MKKALVYFCLALAIVFMGIGSAIGLLAFAVSNPFIAIGIVALLLAAGLDSFQKDEE